MPRWRLFRRRSTEWNDLRSAGNYNPEGTRTIMIYQPPRAAELESLSIFRDFITNACQQQGVQDPEVVYDLKLAVDEACTNIITHGYSGMNPGSIILALEFLLATVL